MQGPEVAASWPEAADAYAARVSGRLTVAQIDAVKPNGNGITFCARMLGHALTRRKGNMVYYGWISPQTT